MRQNTFGQPIGPALADWKTCPFPNTDPINGTYCRLVKLSPAQHGDQLFSAFGDDTDGKNWTYLFDGPFANRTEFGTWLERISQSQDPLFFAIVDTTTHQAIGVASYMRITPEHGTIEVGNIHFSPRLQKTPLATEAMYLMMRHAIEELGYRRYEWKCDALNTPSRSAAERLGFTFEGIFRKAVVYKGRSRDTAWFSMIDSEWPALKAAFEQWLAAENFDDHGKQKQSLKSFRA